MSAQGIAEMEKWANEVRALFNWLPVVIVTDGGTQPGHAVTSLLADGRIQVALAPEMIPGRAVGWHEMCHAIQLTVQHRIDNVLALCQDAYRVRGFDVTLVEPNLYLAKEEMACIFPESFMGQWGGAYHHPLYGDENASRDAAITTWFNSPASQQVRDWFLSLATWQPSVPAGGPVAPVIVETPAGPAGCDISSFQGSVNFDLLKTEVSFVLAKSSEGTGYRDPTFQRNWAEARRVGLTRGAYHFARPDLGTLAQEEAAYFLSSIRPIDAADLLALDYEVQWTGDVVGWCKAFLDLIQQMTGHKPLIYLNLSLVRNHDWSPVIAAGYPLWLALYDDQSNTVPSTPWPNVTMKQWTSSGTLAGVPSRVDLNTLFGGDLPVNDAEFLEKYNRLIQPNLTSTLDQMKAVETKTVLAARAAGEILAKTNLP
jgi:GH25 family lysozyme M1 (1,4-beta-N-acetylmuramidase)